MKKLFTLIFLFFATTAYGQDLGYLSAADCGTLSPVEDSTICLQTTTASGRTEGKLYSYTGSTWVEVAASSSGGHVIKDEGTARAQRTNLNFVGGGVSCIDDAGNDETECTINTGGAPSFDTITGGTNAAAAMIVGTGASLATSGSGTIAATTAAALAANPADCAANNFATTIAANGDLTCAQPASTNLSDTAVIVLENQANTYTTGAQNFASATSLTVPSSAGAAPTVDGQIAYDTTSDTLEYGNSGSTKTVFAHGDNATNVAFTPAGSIAATNVSTAIVELDSEKQPIDADLTNIAGLSCTGMLARQGSADHDCLTLTSSNTSVMTITAGDGSATPTFALTNAVIDGSNHYAADAGSTDDYVACPASISTMSTPALVNGSSHLIRFNTANTTGATINLCTLGAVSLVKVTAAGVSVALATGDIVVGANYLITYHSSNGNFQLLNPTTLSAGGSPAGSDTQVIFNDAGVYNGDSGLTYSKSTDILTATGGIVAGSGNGTLLASSGLTGDRTVTNTVDADGRLGVTTTAARTQNDLTSFDSAGRTEASGTSKWFKVYWDSEGLTLPSGSTCTRASVAAINSGPSGEWVSCTDAATSTFEMRVRLTRTIATGTISVTVNDSDSSSHVWTADFSAMCRGNTDTVNSTWGTSQEATITMATASVNYVGTTPAITPNGTCDTDATLFIRGVIDNAGTHTDGNARIIGVLFTQAS